MIKSQELDNLPANLSDNEHFQSVVERAVSRRGFLKTGLGLSAAAFLAGPLAACGGGGGDDDEKGPTIGFKPVAAATGDSVVVPEGYTASVIIPWGTPLLAGAAAWKTDGTNTGDDQATQIGDNHDGMRFFPIDGKSSSEGLLVVNHEYCNYEYFFGAEYMTPWTADKVKKAINAHGISVVHIKRNGNGKWDVVAGSQYNRRITGYTPMELTGPAAGHALLKTSADATGTQVLGTLNNCANGWTLWGTYLTCEENFNGYFGTTSGTDSRNALMKRYGLSGTTSGYRWEEFEERFDYVKEPNESNRFGWVVEIDPFAPNSKPKKHTALGRFKHENAAMTLAKDGRVVVYLGDDQANDYIYKFVSNGKYDASKGGANSALLDSGKLYVAKFGAGAKSGDMLGDGQWVLLDKAANPTLAASAEFADQAELLIKTRLAADAVGATKMDRPEWIAVHPDSGEVYCTLTNNTGRSSTDDANPRAKNAYGQIIRWREAGDDAGALSFEWDLFVLAGNPVTYPDRNDLRSGSANITADNTFNSPDGLGFDKDGRLWIETDGKYTNKGDFANQGNNQMLCANPVTKEIKRFLVGPSGCEITGLTFTPDSKTMFINIQHPGEAEGHPRAPSEATLAGADLSAYLAANPLAFSAWPSAAGGRPRAATVVITKNDGGVIGS